MYVVASSLNISSACCLDFSVSFFLCCIVNPLWTRIKYMKLLLFLAVFHLFVPVPTDTRFIYIYIDMRLPSLADSQPRPNLHMVGSRT